MSEHHIRPEWQSLGEEIHRLIGKHREMPDEGMPGHSEAGVRIEGFLEALNGCH